MAVPSRCRLPRRGAAVRAARAARVTPHAVSSGSSGGRRGRWRGGQRDASPQRQGASPPGGRVETRAQALETPVSPPARAGDAVRSGDEGEEALVEEVVEIDVDVDESELGALSDEEREEFSLLHAAQARAAGLGGATSSLLWRGLDAVREGAGAVAQGAAQRLAQLEVDRVRYLVVSYARDWRRQARAEASTGGGAASAAAAMSDAATAAAAMSDAAADTPYEDQALMGGDGGTASTASRKRRAPPFDREALAPFLEPASEGEVRTMRQAAALCAATYELRRVVASPEGLRRVYGVRLVAHSLERKHAAAAASAARRAAEAAELQAREAELMDSRAFGYANARGAGGARRGAEPHSLVSEAHKLSDEEATERATNASEPAEQEVGADDRLNGTLGRMLERALRRAQEEELSPQPVEWLCVKDARTNTHYFALQGSDNLGHWRTNLSFDPVPFEGFEDVSAHRGIYESSMQMYDILAPLVREHLSSPTQRAADGTPLPPRVGFTGHSLGGSLAFLVALIMHARGDIAAREQLAPLYMFGAPQSLCGAGALMGRSSSLPASLFRSVIMHKDIVPRALACYYPDAVAQLLTRANDTFGRHECLACQSMLFSPIGRTYLLQPPTKVAAEHALLPPGPGIYALSTPGSSVRQLANAGARASDAGRWTPPSTIVGPARNAKGVAVDPVSDSDDDRPPSARAAGGRAPAGGAGAGFARALSCDTSAVNVAGAVSAAERAFLNSPHPLDILADAGAYGPAGTISRHHNPDNYTRALGSVLRTMRVRRRRVRHANGGARVATARAAAAALRVEGAANPAKGAHRTAVWLGARHRTLAPGRGGALRAAAARGGFVARQPLPADDDV